MAQQRQRQGGFRFSLPWMTSQASPQPKTSQPSVVEARSTTAQRQSPRVVPSQNSNQQQTPPSRAPPSKDTETQKPSPSRASTQPRAINSQPPSPSRIGTQSRPISKKPSRNISNTKSTSSITQSPPKIDPLTSPIFNEDEKMIVEPKLKVEEESHKLGEKPEETMKGKEIVQDHKESATPSKDISFTLATESKEEKESHKLGEKPEETIKGKEIVQDHKESAAPSKDIRFTLATESKELNLSHDKKASDGEQTHVEEEDIVSTEETLNPTSPTNEYSKTVISDALDKGRAHISHLKTTTSESKPMHKGIQDDVSKFVHKVTKEHQNLSLDERQVSVITLMGENRGALMTLSHESGKKAGKINIHRGYKVDPNESSDSTEEEESLNEENTKGSKIQDDEETKAYINSNTQSVNNSIVFNSTMTERDAGVHFTMSRMVMEHVDKTKSNEPLDAHKPKVSVSQSQKLSYKPIVRRRCLKGLFMESSDSDPDNPDKPRRHGCRVACGGKNNIDVL